MTKLLSLMTVFGLSLATSLPVLAQDIKFARPNEMLLAESAIQFYGPDMNQSLMFDLYAAFACTSVIDPDGATNLAQALTGENSRGALANNIASIKVLNPQLKKSDADVAHEYGEARLKVQQDFVQTRIHFSQRKAAAIEDCYKLKISGI